MSKVPGGGGRYLRGSYIYPAGGALSAKATDAVISAKPLQLLVVQCIQHSALTDPTWNATEYA